MKGDADRYLIAKHRAAGDVPPWPFVNWQAFFAHCHNEARRSDLLASVRVLPPLYDWAGESEGGVR